MPARKVVLATDETYHIFNRSLRGNIFNNKRGADRFIKTIKYYLQVDPPVKFSYFLKQPEKYPIDLSNKVVEIYAFCLMPNHFHLLLRQARDKGIQNYMHKITNSYAHYFNLKNGQKGPVFEGKFKAVRVGNSEQFIHLSRYIHLNPATDYIVENPVAYNHSSYRHYISKEILDFVNKEDVMENFTPASYEKFVLDRKHYQRNLNELKRLLLD